MNTKLRVSLAVCALMVMACSGDGEQFELVTVQAVAPTTAAPITPAAEVIDPPDISALDDDLDERQTKIKASESEVDAEGSEIEAAIDELKADLKAEMADVEVLARELDEILADPLIYTC